MAEVELARVRGPGGFSKLVVLKRLRTDDDAMRSMFLNEARLAALLHHPNVVQTYEVSEIDGSYFIAMEYLDGQSLDKIIRETQKLGRPLTAGFCARVVADALSGLHYAHELRDYTGSSLHVVHRDVSPHNLFLTYDGTVKLLFGIAKLLAPAAGFEREAKTRTGSRLFTPEYASPEQARGDAVSTATDVYSVGAVLYELVTGEPAHRTTGSALDILRVICEVDPPRPSSVAPAARRRELGGDLDNIILKALHKEPGRRYASMEQLSEDLGRWLDGLPVAARTATLGYRARKFVRRNKGVVVAATLIAATLIAATVVSLRQADRADDERAHAVDAAQRAQIEADRARKAEEQVKQQLDEIRTEQAARTAAEAEARDKASEAEMTREQLQVALTKAREEKQLAEQHRQLAEQESARARAAEVRAQAAAQAEKAARQEKEALLQKERERVKQLEERRKEITTRPL